MYRGTARGSLLYSEPSRAYGAPTGGRRRGHAVADNERLVGRDTQLAPIGQALNRVGAGKAALLAFHAHRTGCPPDGGVLVVRSGRRRPVGDGEQPENGQCHPQCYLVPPIGHNWEMRAAATAITDLERRYASKAAHAALYDLRAPDVESLQQLETRVRACFEAGGLFTGCAHEVTQAFPGYTDLVPRPWLAAAYRVAITGLAAATDDAQRERLIGAQRE
jgi:hypothetical protein